MLVTPKMACLWLTRNTHLYPPRREKIEQYKREWATWPEGYGGRVIFSPDGYLLDGRHRLSVIAETGIARELEVIIAAEAPSNRHRAQLLAGSGTGQVVTIRLHPGEWSVWDAPPDTATRRALGTPPIPKR